MATVTVYFLNTAATAPNWFGRVQDGGSAPAGALSAFGWTVGKTAVTSPYWRGRIGATGLATVAAAASYIDAAVRPVQGTGAGITTAGDSFRSDNPLTGTFAAGNWNFTFGMRTGAATTVGRVRLHVWASANADGTGTVRKLTSTALVGTTVTMATTTTTYNSTVTWAAPQVVLNGEYLFTQIEWQETTAGTANGCTAQFYQCSFVTTDWFYSLSASNLVAPTPVLGAPDLASLVTLSGIADADGVGGSSVVGTKIAGVAVVAAGVGGSSVVGEALLPNYVSGDFTASGVGASNIVGEVVIVTTDATAAAAGTGATAVTGTGIKAATATAAGISTTTVATGSSLAASTATATGTGATTITGRAVTERTVTAGGVGASNIATRSFYSTIALSSGIGAGGATGAYIFGVAVTAAGTGASSVIGGQVGVNAFAGAGLGTATATGASSAATTATAAGVGSTTVVGTSIKSIVAGAAGLAAGTATGRSFAAGAVSAAGTSTATATGLAILARTVTAAGVGVATAAGGQVGANAFSAAGIGAANAVGRSTAAVVGAATGIGATSWTGTALKAVDVTATGAGAAAATGRAFVAGVATAAGTGTSAFVARATLNASNLVAPLPVFENPSVSIPALLRLGDRVLDYGLVTLDLEADKIYICNGFPNTYLEATSTFAIGSKSFGQGLVFGAPAAGVPKGRKITSVAVADGLATEIGTPQCWAAVDSVNSRLLATGPATGFRTVGVNWSWTLEQIPIHMDG